MNLHGTTSKHFLVLSKGSLTLQPHVFIEHGYELLSSLIYSPKGQLHCFGRPCSFGSSCTLLAHLACSWVHELDRHRGGIAEEIIGVYGREAPVKVALAAVRMRGEVEPRPAHAVEECREGVELFFGVFDGFGLFKLV